MGGWIPSSRVVTGRGGGVRSARRRSSRISVPTRRRVSTATVAGICGGEQTEGTRLRLGQPRNDHDSAAGTLLLGSSSSSCPNSSAIRASSGAAARSARADERSVEVRHWQQLRSTRLGALGLLRA